MTIYPRLPINTNAFSCYGRFCHHASNSLKEYPSVIRSRCFCAPKSTKTDPSKTRARLRGLNNRLPLFLQKYLSPLMNAPVTHVTSFLILHEITAVLPLFGLVGIFHFGDWVPQLGDGEMFNNTFNEGVERFGKWLRKKGWVDGENTDFNEDVTGKSRENTIRTDERNMTSKPNSGVRLVLEFATAYALTKALLPLRIVASVWATPWFASAVLAPFGRSVRRTLAKIKKTD